MKLRLQTPSRPPRTRRLQINQRLTLHLCNRRRDLWRDPSQREALIIDNLKLRINPLPVANLVEDKISRAMADHDLNSNNSSKIDPSLTRTAITPAMDPTRTAIRIRRRPSLQDRVYPEQVGGRWSASSPPAP